MYRLVEDFFNWLIFNFWRKTFPTYSGPSYLLPRGFSSTKSTNRLRLNSKFVKNPVKLMIFASKPHNSIHWDKNSAFPNHLKSIAIFWFKIQTIKSPVHSHQQVSLDIVSILRPEKKSRKKSTYAYKYLKPEVATFLYSKIKHFT